MRGHLPPAGTRVVFGANRAEEHVERGHPQLQAERPVAVVWEKPVVAGLEMKRAGNVDGLVADAADLEEGAVLSLKLNLLVVNPPRQVHGAVGGDDQVAGELLSFQVRDCGSHQTSETPVDKRPPLACRSPARAGRLACASRPRCSDLCGAGERCPGTQPKLSNPRPIKSNPVGCWVA